MMIWKLKISHRSPFLLDRSLPSWLPNHAFIVRLIEQPEGKKEEGYGDVMECVWHFFFLGGGRRTYDLDPTKKKKDMM